MLLLSFPSCFWLLQSIAGLRLFPQVFEDDWSFSQAPDSGCPSESLLEEEAAPGRADPDPDLLPASNHHRGRSSSWAGPKHAGVRHACTYLSSSPQTTTHAMSPAHLPLLRCHLLPMSTWGWSGTRPWTLDAPCLRTKPTPPISAQTQVEKKKKKSQAGPTVYHEAPPPPPFFHLFNIPDSFQRSR